MLLTKVIFLLEIFILFFARAIDVIDVINSEFFLYTIEFEGKWGAALVTILLLPLGSAKLHIH